MENERTYSEQQVKDILMKAVDLQQQGAMEGSSDPNGLSREQLLKMAAELGIDAKYVESAIDQARVSRREEKAISFLGIPLARTHKAVVEGELDPERFDVIVPELGATGIKGVGSSQVGRSLTARVQKGMAFGPLSVVSRDGKTRIEARHVAFMGFMLGLYPSIIFALVGGLNLAKHANPMLGLGFATALLAAGSGAFAIMAKKADEAMKALVGRIAEVVADETKEQGVRQNLSRATSVSADSEVPQVDRA